MSNDYGDGNNRMVANRWRKPRKGLPVKNTLSIVVHIVLRRTQTPVRWKRGRHGISGKKNSRIPDPTPFGSERFAPNLRGTINNGRLPPFSESIDVFVPVQRRFPYLFCVVMWFPWPPTLGHAPLEPRLTVSTAICTTNDCIRPVARR